MIVIAEGSNGVVQANSKISLSTTQAQTISVDFATQDGSALAGQDYVSTNGTVTFAPGETVKVVPVLVTADEAPEPMRTSFSPSATNQRIHRPTHRELSYY